MEQYQNALIYESSLYLKQHAHNPVNWVPWSKKAFEQAEQEGKLVLISIGYSSCHWCHVMEHESFEDEEVAAIMNKHFVCIKVDREERPDVDQVYMTAVQLMTQRGGWPLNCFTIPSGKPIYGGTYFQKEQWIHILKSLVHMYREEREKVLHYAAELEKGVREVDLIEVAQPIQPFPEDKLWELVRRWEARMDKIEGGTSSPPKFPLPSNYEFLFWYALKQNNPTISDYVNLTLRKMALGGIYDQVGGGFSRYSVDMLWKIPHFEKMLYDNGQLLSLYAQVYRESGDPEFLRVLYRTTRWLEREMHDPEGSFYAAQDADSEGEEGKYYVWHPNELKEILGEEASWFLNLYNPSNKGYWEENKWVLLRNETWEEWIKSNPNCSVEKIENQLDLLLHVRSKRIAPVTDKKCLTAWNALTLSGFIACYQATTDEVFLRHAWKIATWIQEFQLNGCELFHVRQDGRSAIPGFLDDYATTIQAFVNLYQVTGEKKLLETASRLCLYTLEHFYDKQSGMFFFTSDTNELIARKMEINDNVIPSTNSIMAHNLLTLSLLTDTLEWGNLAKQMLQNVIDGMEQYGSGYSNWALLLLRFEQGVQLIKLPRSAEWKKFSLQVSPFLVIQHVDDQLASYCFDGICSLPISHPAELQSMVR